MMVCKKKNQGLIDYIIDYIDYIIRVNTVLVFLKMLSTVQSSHFLLSSLNVKVMYLAGERFQAAVPTCTCVDI